MRRHGLHKETLHSSLANISWPAMTTSVNLLTTSVY